jgi:hypothetical protein
MRAQGNRGMVAHCQACALVTTTRCCTRAPIAEHDAPYPGKQCTRSRRSRPHPPRPARDQHALSTHRAVRRRQPRLRGGVVVLWQATHCHCQCTAHSALCVGGGGAAVPLSRAPAAGTSTARCPWGSARCWAGCTLPRSSLRRRRTPTRSTSAIDGTAAAVAVAVAPW